MIMSQFKRRDSVHEALEMIIANCNQKPENLKMLSKAWHIALFDITDDQIQYGLVKILKRNSNFLPTVGELRENCLTSPGCNSIEEEAIEAWLIATKNKSYHATLIFKNTVIAETIRNTGGKHDFTGIYIKDEPFKRKEFIDTYKILKKREEEYSSRLIGQEKENINYIGFDNDEEKKQILIELKKEDETAKKALILIRKNYEVR